MMMMMIVIMTMKFKILKDTQTKIYEKPYSSFALRLSSRELSYIFFINLYPLISELLDVLHSSTSSLSFVHIQFSLGKGGGLIGQKNSSKKTYPV